MMTATYDQFDCQYKRFLFVLKMATLEAWHNAKRLRLENDAKHHYNPAQPRVPAGNPDGGQWTDDVAFGGDGVPAHGGSGLRGTISDDVIMLPEVVVRASRSRDTSNKKPNKGKFDRDKAIAVLRARAHDDTTHYCAQYVRIALEAGGAIINRIKGFTDAKYYGRYLQEAGFDLVSPTPEANYAPVKGDVVVIQPYKGGSPEGHIAMYDGEQWISDFRQGNQDLWPGRAYRKAKPTYKIYRYAQ